MTLSKPAASPVPIRRRRAATTTALGLALALLSACAGGAEVSEGGTGGNGTGVVRPN